MIATTRTISMRHIPFFDFFMFFIFQLLLELFCVFVCYGPIMRRLRTLTNH